MIPLLLMLAAAQAAPGPRLSDQELLARCLSTVKSDAAKAVEQASDWRIRGGGLGARQCLGLAYVELERWEPAATAFEQAAGEAETAKDRRLADFWVQAGNAWLAAGDGAKARRALDAALATSFLSPELRGEVFLDRARAGVMLNEIGIARTDLDKGLALVPSDPFGWYLSAALAQRENRMDRAKADIAKAVSLAPDDADIRKFAAALNAPEPAPAAASAQAPAKPKPDQSR